METFFNIFSNTTLSNFKHYHFQLPQLKGGSNILTTAIRPTCRKTVEKKTFWRSNILTTAIRSRCEKKFHNSKIFQLDDSIMSIHSKPNYLRDSPSPFCLCFKSPNPSFLTDITTKPGDGAVVPIHADINLNQSNVQTLSMVLTWIYLHRYTTTVL